MSQDEQNDLTALTVQLLSAYVSKNEVASADLADLIQSTRAALAGVPAVEEPASPVFTPAVSARKSLASRDHILSMIDGKPYKTLKRHLASHGLSPKEYLERYKLPSDYPLVAPAYSEIRRQTAAKIGLGHNKKAVAPASSLVAETTSEAVPAVVAAPVNGKPKTEAKKAPARKKAVVKSQPEATPATETVKVAPARKARSIKSTVKAPPATAPEKDVKASVVEAPAIAKRKAGRPPKPKAVAPSAE